LVFPLQDDVPWKWYNGVETIGSTHNFVSLEASVKNHYGCPVQGTINVVSGKWKVLAIWHLGFGPQRFAQLRGLLPGISEKVLTSQLRQMETDGIVKRQIKRASPPQVTYSLTRAGRELIEPMSALCEWGTRYLGIPPNFPRRPKGA
jgi:DNA-binding HxlR family transcriptional regulator